MQDLPTHLAQRTNWAYAEPASGTTLEITKTGHINFATGASGETNTLPIPQREGVRLVLNCYSHGGGDRVITAASAINVAGNTIMTFGAARDNLVLESIKTASGVFAWEVRANNNVALS